MNKIHFSQPKNFVDPQGSDTPPLQLSILCVALSILKQKENQTDTQIEIGQKKIRVLNQTLKNKKKKLLQNAEQLLQDLKKQSLISTKTMKIPLDLLIRSKERRFHPLILEILSLTPSLKDFYSPPVETFLLSVRWAEDPRLPLLLEYRAENNHEGALLILGMSHERGLLGFQKDTRKAVDYFSRAAIRESFLAQFLLGNLYADRITSIQTFDLAKSWYEKAANQGYKQAQQKLNELSFLEGTFQQITLNQ